MPVLKVGVEQVQDMAKIVLLLGLQKLTAVTAVPRACTCPCRRQMSYVTLGATASQQASRVQRWRAALDGCRADATVLGEGATGWPWQVSIVFADIRFLLA